MHDIAEANAAQVVANDGAALRGRGVWVHAIHTQPHVVPCRQPWNQARRLEHQCSIRTGAANLSTVQRNHAFADRRQTRQHRQDRGLAAARVADDRNEFAPSDVQFEAVDDLDGAAGAGSAGRRIAFADVREFDESGHCQPGLDFCVQRAWRGLCARGAGLYVGQRRWLSALFVALVAQVQQVAGDGFAQLNELGVAVQRHAIARSRQVDPEHAAEARPRSRMQRQHAIGQQYCFVHIVGDQQHRGALLFTDTHQLVLQVGASQCIQRRQRFVEQQDFRFHGEGPRERHTLAHAAGQLRGFLVARRREIDHVDVPQHTRSAHAGRLVGENLVDGQRDVFKHAHPRHERIVLKHHAALRARPGHGLAVHIHAALIWRQQSAHEVDERALAASRETDNGYELAGFDR